MITLHFSQIKPKKCNLKTLVQTGLVTMTTHMLRLQLITQDEQLEKTELIEHARN